MQHHSFLLRLTLQQSQILYNSPAKTTFTSKKNETIVRNWMITLSDEKGSGCTSQHLEQPKSFKPSNPLSSHFCSQRLEESVLAS